MSYRKRRALRSLDAGIQAVTVSSRQVETLLAAMLLPVVPRDEWTQAATDALVAFVWDQRIPDFTMELSEDRKTVTFSPPSVMNAIERAGGFAFTALSPMTTPASGSWGELLVKLMMMRHMATPLMLKLPAYEELGVTDQTAVSATERYLTSIEVLSRSVADWIEETPSVRNGISIKGDALGLTWEDAVEILREPFPRVGEGNGLSASPVLIAGGILVGIVVIAVVVGIYFWQEPARVDAERQLTEAEVELEAMKTVTRSIEAGLTPEQVAELLNPVTELRERRPPPMERSNALFWLLGGAALVTTAAVVGTRLLRRSPKEETPVTA